MIILLGITSFSHLQAADEVTCRMARMIPNGVSELSELSVQEKQKLLIKSRETGVAFLSFQQLEAAIYYARVSDFDSYCRFTEAERNQIEGLVAVHLNSQINR